MHPVEEEAALPAGRVRRRLAVWNTPRPSPFLRSRGVPYQSSVKSMLGRAGSGGGSDAGLAEADAACSRDHVTAASCPSGP